MLIAEDLLLLLTDDETGRLATSAEQVDVALAGANLLELALAGRVDVTSEADEGKRGRIIVRDSSRTGDEVLDSALDVLADRQGKKPAAVLKPLARDLRRTLYERLARNGVVRAQEGRMLGVFPSHRWPAEDSSHEAEVRRLIVQALVQQVTPDPRSAALVSLLHALRCEHKVVDLNRHELSKRELRKRAEQIARGSWASEAVRKAIDETVSAVIAATAAAGAVAAGSD